MEHAFVNVFVRLGYHVTGLEFFKQGMLGQEIEGALCLGGQNFIPPKDTAHHSYSGS
jgi:hypothetical protein